MKKLNRFQTFAIAIVMAVAVAVPVAVAQSSDPGPGKGRGGHWREHGPRGGGFFGFRNLNLTDAQKAQIKQIQENSRQSLRPIMDEIRAKRQEIRQASEGSTFNEALVSQKLAEIAPLEAKLMGAHFRLRQEMLSVLTAEQKTKLEQSREQFEQRRSERRANKQQKSQ